MSVLDNPGKIVGVMAIGSLVGLALFGAAAFFVQPHAKDIVDTVVAAFKDAFLVTSGVKAGLSMPKSDPTPDPAPTPEPDPQQK